MKTNFRQDFPILNDEANPVVYLDSAATTQKPLSVIKLLHISKRKSSSWSL